MLEYDVIRKTTQFRTIFLIKLPILLVLLAKISKCINLPFSKSIEVIYRHKFLFDYPHKIILLCNKEIVIYKLDVASR